MTTPFSSNSTTDEVLEGRDLRGKRILITGVSSGLGRETARALLAHGADVVGTARELATGGDELDQAAGEGGANFVLRAMDLADLASVKSISDELLAEGTPLDLVILNAGIMAPPLGRTRDGFELQFGTNFLGHFALATRLAPLMREGARLVVLSSNAHRMADVDLDDPNFENTAYDPWVAYGRSKTADALLAVAFDARNRARGVRAASVHPGIIMTELARSIDPAEFGAAMTAMSEQHIALGNAPFEPKSVPQGAATTVWAGLVADADAIGGRYCEDCGVGQILDRDAAVSAFAPGVLPYALDEDRAEALWRLAEELVGPAS